VSNVRNIWPGELSIVTRHILSIAENVKTDPELAFASPYAIVLKAVKASHLEYLLEYPVAVK
jgi:hypothetical protein